MNQKAIADESAFRRILARNMALPLGICLLGAVLFIGLILYMLDVLGWVEHTDRVISSANEMQRLSVDQESGLRGFLITGDPRFLEPLEQARPRINAGLKGLADLVADNPPQVERVQRLTSMQDEWMTFAQQMIEQRRSGQDTSDAIKAGRGKSMMDAIRGQYASLINTEQQLRHDRNQFASSLSTGVVILYLVFSIVVGTLLAYFGRRQLLGLSDSYAESLRRQVLHNEHLERQAWLSDGQTRLGEQLIGQPSLSALGRSLMDFLGDFVASPVGALYVRDDRGGLRVAGTFGFAAQSLGEDYFAADDSLIAQAARQRKLRLVDGLPPDYLKVNSALGNGQPVSVALLPLVHEASVVGVLELGFLRQLEERDKAFLQVVAEPLGSAIASAQHRQRLQDLLAETQQLNEELQVQQEELKTANEELEEQSRVLKESQAHLEAQQAELEQTNERLAEQAQELAAQRDDLDSKNTELNQARLDLQGRADELQRASRYKSEFLANMSHELRTPLNSSLILARLLADNEQGNLDDEQVKFAESIYSAGNDLLNLINDILDISKVEAGKLEVRPENASVRRLVEGVEGLFRPQADDKGLTFVVNIADDAPGMLYSDRQRVEQILKNLLSNAFKFTDAGEVSLYVGAAPEGLRFDVRDSGIGIAEDQLQRIFEAFQQADGATNRRYGGTGLGLSISRDLAHLLGGSIIVSSQPGKGSVFSLLLPLSYNEPAATEVVSAPAAIVPRVATPVAAPAVHAPVAAAFADDREQLNIGQRCVLVVEDEPKFARILYDLARELGYRCLVAMGAEEGLRLADEHGPDAILLDMHLPDESGLAVLQRLKANPRTRHVPVHVVSVEDRSEAALHLGAIGYALKPTTREQLREVFGKLEAKLTQEVKRILLVEDDPLQRDSVSRLIGDDDIEITAVEQGEQALELLRQNIYDCMIIDLKLPDMQGNELLRRMGEEDICSFPPVIVYTGRNLTRDEEAELLKYSRSIIIKGARSPERLLDEVTLFLHKVESQLSSERQRMLRTSRNRDRAFEERRILLVDDDVRNIFALTSALEHKGARVVVARNGREAIEKLAQVGDIDLVLMDVMMPEMDGYEATRLIRQDARWKKLPILAVTAKAMKDDHELCLRAGANDYLAKPIDLDRLFSLIRVWLPKLERI
ncbi:response regulator [Pseudomonas nitroreducens]|uniref:response regulator n=1 Tax=Pseudomonas TaxID=286 RepID=UPI0002E3D7EC|nr:response regulator [Pseudomonas nitroreducens]